jgi:hypothetical protein
VADANIFERFFNGIFDSTDFQVQLHWTIALTAFAWKHPSAFTVEGVVQIVNDMAMQSERSVINYPGLFAKLCSI